MLNFKHPFFESIHEGKKSLILTLKSFTPKFQKKPIQPNKKPIQIETPDSEIEINQNKKRTLNSSSTSPKKVKSDSGNERLSPFVWSDEDVTLQQKTISSTETAPEILKTLDPQNHMDQIIIENNNVVEMEIQTETKEEKLLVKIPIQKEEISFVSNEEKLLTDILSNEKLVLTIFFHFLSINDTTVTNNLSSQWFSFYIINKNIKNLIDKAIISSPLKELFQKHTSFLPCPIIHIIFFPKLLNILCDKFQQFVDEKIQIKKRFAHDKINAYNDFCYEFIQIWKNLKLNDKSKEQLDFFEKNANVIKSKFWWKKNVNKEKTQKIRNSDAFQLTPLFMDMFIEIIRDISSSIEDYSSFYYLVQQTILLHVQLVYKLDAYRTGLNFVVAFYEALGKTIFGDQTTKKTSIVCVDQFISKLKEFTTSKTHLLND